MTEPAASPAASPAGDVTSFTYLCIGCPLGCRLEVDETESGEIFEVRGFSCKRGDEFARQEHVDPRRQVTTTVWIDGAAWPRLPVKTSGTVPRHMVGEVCRVLWEVRVQAPIALGDVIVADVLGTGNDVVATRSMPAVH
jgi:CxxC motif-containing protein